MAEKTLEIEGFEELLAEIDDLEQGADLMGDIILDTMIACLSLIEQEIVNRTPVGVTGNLRAATATEIMGTPVALDGLVVNPITYGLPVEFGRKPGKAPMVFKGKGPRGGLIFDAVPELELWIKRVMGVPDNRVKAVARLVALRIGQRGTEGAFMFRDGWAAALPQVERMWEDALDKIVDRLVEA